MSVHKEIFEKSDLDLAKRVLSNNHDISAELFWSLLFWKTPELFFLSINKSTKISKEQLSTSLSKMLLDDFNKTFDSIVMILARLCDLIEILSLEPIELHSRNSPLPNLQDVIFLYITIIYTAFPHVNEELISFNSSQGVRLCSILCKTRAIINNNSMIYRDFDRTMKKVSQLIHIKHGLLKGLLNGIADQITQVPIIQQLNLE
ncbi:hypothetical protein OIY81_1251 [Cryptosporidium canis]|uniref:Uncharacterized protein n=1 Tax=Cryptosporidium canis TaxID=195482 RepID=A0ABQ8P9Q5_9CRYT|nr:hypothetical protein OIY81_1251 [Cryptosporidium canis]KAJ1613957.1 hypothetical protein OJ252_849 [Cryptosporidium canis]